MNPKWLNNLDEKEQETLKRQAKTSLFSKVLLKQLYSMEQELLSVERDAQQYENANWAYKQADRNGRLAMLRLLIKSIIGE